MRDILIFVALHYWFWILLGVFIVFCFFVILVTAVFEKYYIRQFVPGMPEEVCPPSGYFLAMNEAAAKLGFRHCGDYIQSGGSSLYKCCLSLWLSPDELSLIVVGGGKLAKINYKRTFFLSVADGGQEIITVDDFGLSDLSKLREIDVVFNADLNELKVRHSQRLAMPGVSTRKFSPSRCLEQYEDLAKVRAENFVSLGLAKFLDLPESMWRYTFKGALANTYHGYLKGLQKAQLQKDRCKVKRPGS